MDGVVGDGGGREWRVVFLWVGRILITTVVSHIRTDKGLHHTKKTQFLNRTYYSETPMKHAVKQDLNVPPLSSCARALHGPRPCDFWQVPT